MKSLRKKKNIYDKKVKQKISQFYKAELQAVLHRRKYNFWPHN